MAQAALLILQAALPLPPAPAPDARLLHPAAPEHCDRSGTAITVCGETGEAYRLHGSGPQVEPVLPARAEWRLFGDARMNVHGEQRSVGGFAAPAAMATVTVPF